MPKAAPSSSAPKPARNLFAARKAAAAAAAARSTSPSFPGATSSTVSTTVTATTATATTAASSPARETAAGSLDAWVERQQKASKRRYFVVLSPTPSPPPPPSVCCAVGTASSPLLGQTTPSSWSPTQPLPSPSNQLSVGAHLASVSHNPGQTTPSSWSPTPPPAASAPSSPPSEPFSWSPTPPRLASPPGSSLDVSAVVPSLVADSSLAAAAAATAPTAPTAQTALTAHTAQTARTARTAPTVATASTTPRTVRTASTVATASTAATPPSSTAALAVSNAVKLTAGASRPSQFGPVRNGRAALRDITNPAALSTRSAPVAFSLRQEGTGNRGMTRHGSIAKQIVRKKLGLPPPRLSERLERTQRAGEGAFAKDIRKVKVVVSRYYSTAGGTAYWYWTVHASGFLKDIRGKKTIILKFLFRTEEDAVACKSVFERIIRENWQKKDYREIRNLVRKEVYGTEVDTQMASSTSRFNFQNHEVERELRHRRCMLYTLGSCSVPHICPSCKLPILSCLLVGVEMQCFACSIRKWGQIWRQTSLNNVLKLIIERDQAKDPRRPSLTLKEARQLHLSASALPTSPARHNHDANDADNISLCESMAQLISQFWPSGNAGSIASLPPHSTTQPSDDPSRQTLCWTDLVVQPIFYGYSVFLNAKERLAALSPSIDLRYQHSRTHTPETCCIVPRWYNCAKKHGLGIIINLYILAAQLQHSLAGSADEVAQARREIGSIVVRLQKLDEASQEWNTAQGGSAGDVARIEAVENLFTSKPGAIVAAEVIGGLAQRPFKFAPKSFEVTQAQLRGSWAETRGSIRRFVTRFVEPFLAANPRIKLKRNAEGFPTLFLPESTSTYDMCGFLFARAQRAILSCDARNKERRGQYDDDGDIDIDSGIADETDRPVGHQFMGPLAVAGYLLMSASQSLPSAASPDAPVDPFDGHTLPDPWSGLPLFSAPTTLIAHKDHSRFFHLGFETNSPRFGDWQPEKVNARMELWKSNWMMQSLRLSTLVAILVSTRSHSKKWLKTLADVGLVSNAQDGLRALESDLDLASLCDHFGYNGVSKLELGWSRARSS